MSNASLVFPSNRGFGLTRRQWYKGQILAGLCANPNVFAHNHKCGWGLVNASDAQLMGYVGQLADEALGEDTTDEERTAATKEREVALLKGLGEWRT